MMSCQNCGKEFRAYSNKTNVCSTECRFDFYAGIKDTNECIEWSGPVNNQGYSVLCISGYGSGKRSVVSAHRYSYEKYKCEIPENKCVMHTCDNPKCVNPKHLNVGTWADNNRDRSLKGRSGSRKFTEQERLYYSKIFSGENNPTAKLTQAQAEEIRKLPRRSKNGRGDGYTRQEIADMYGVSLSVIKSILSGRSYVSKPD